MQVVVVYAVLVVLEGDHGEGKGPHAAWAPVGQPHLQAYGVTHVAGRRFTVTRLSVHQHIYKRHRTQTQGHDPASLPTRPPVCPSPLLHPPRLPPRVSGWVLGHRYMAQVTYRLVDRLGARAVTQRVCAMLEGPRRPPACLGFWEDLQALLPRRAEPWPQSPGAPAGGGKPG